MKIIKTIVYFIFWLVDLFIPDRILIKIVRFNNKLFGHFVIYKINSDLNRIELNKQGSEYWRTISAIFYFIYTKNLNLKNTNTEKILNKLLNEIEHFNTGTRYLEIGCGYPIYLKNPFLREKIRNYYGYDLNPYIANFFSIKNIFNFYPENNEYDVILILSGVIKYFSDEELRKFLEIMNKMQPEKMIISHKVDYKIIKCRINQLNSNPKFHMLKKIELIQI